MSFIITAGGDGGFTTAIFYTSSTSITIPGGKTSVRFTVTGGGAGTVSGGSVRGTGGAGGTAIKTITSASVGGSVATLTIGAGGTPGNAGGNSIVSVTIGGTLYTITGVGGTTNNSNGGVGGSATGGDLNIDGGDGGLTSSGAPSPIGVGGASFWGGGGGTDGGNSRPGRAYGSGAGGLVNNLGGSASGKQGVILVEY